MRTPARAAIAAAALLAAAPALAGGPPFVRDDYARALADARRRNVPLVVDAWAPW